MLAFATLYACFRLKHFLGDFVFQTPEMAGAKAEGRFDVLLLHSMIHALGTLFIVTVFAPEYWWLSPLDFFVHAWIDSAKSSITRYYWWTPDQATYWWAFGLDQEAHHFTHFAYIVAIVRGI